MELLIPFMAKSRQTPLTFKSSFSRNYEVVWKIWTSHRQVLSDKLLGSCRYLVHRTGRPVNLIRGLVVKPLMPPFSIIELEIII